MCNNGSNIQDTVAPEDYINHECNLAALLYIELILHLSLFETL